ncbi:MAG: Enoyl-CoA hydratase/isomerase [Microbacteriaceae bacterium]|nr:Enoyl-CoA hydratase/isomerase [Microbacteriaceae bacterium]
MPDAPGVEPAVFTERRGHVAVITLNRPGSLNAIDSRLSMALAVAVDECVRDTDVRAIVLTGAGRAFCAGHDLGAIAAGETLDDARHPEWGYAGIVERPIDKPLIAAAHGFMLGAGLEIGLACDLIVGTPTLQLGLPEVRRGLIAAAGGIPRLAQQLPPHIASWLIFSGELIGAEVAERWGLVNEIVPEEQVLERAVALAGRIAENAPLAVQASKRLVRRLSRGSTWTDDAWSELNEEFAGIRGTSDALEGATAFVERRDPRWSSS